MARLDRRVGEALSRDDLQDGQADRGGEWVGDVRGVEEEASLAGSLLDLGRGELPPPLLATLKHAALMPNPVFYERQRRGGHPPVDGLVGSCFDNAAAEAFFSSLDWEVLSRHEFDTTANARAVVMDWCYGFYNSQRRHSAAAGSPRSTYDNAALTRDAA